MAKTAKRGIIRYKSYLFIDKDPVIDALRTSVSQAHVRYTQLAEDSGVSSTTISNWFVGKTRRPQFCTVMAVTKALGKKGVAVNRSGNVILVD
jgi:DNA-binding phage protein